VRRLSDGNREMNAIGQQRSMAGNIDCGQSSEHS
jgi:hypothetical protein